MKFDQGMKYEEINIFRQCRKSWSKRGRETIPDLFLFFEKASYEVKASGLQLSFNIF